MLQQTSETGEPFANGWTLGRRQLTALLRRQLLIKTRAWGTTLAELCTPVLLICMLVVAYHLVHPDHHDARVYAGDTAELLHNMTRDGLQTSTASDVQLCAAYLQSGSRGSAVGDTKEAGSNATSHWASPAGNHSSSSSMWQTLLDSGLVAKLLASLLKGQGIPAERQAAFLDCMQDALRSSSSFSTTAVALQTLQGFISGNGPLPIPSFGEFVALHMALKSALASQPGAIKALRGARRHWGWNLLGNLLDLGKIAFSPASPEVLKFAAYMEEKYGTFFTDNFHGVFATEAEGEDFALRSAERLWALVNFNSGPTHLGTTDVVIRMNYTTVPRTWVPVNEWKRHLSVHYKEYLSSGFLSLQSAIDGYVLQTAGATHDTSLQLPSATGPPSWTVWSVPFPTAAYNHNRFYDAVGPMLGLLMALSLVYPLSQLIRGLVEEKETGARDLMLCQNLQSWVLPAAWAITYGAILAIVSAAVTVVCCASFLRFTAPTLLLVLLMAFAVAELSFGMLVASMFSRAKLAAIAGLLLHFCMLLPRYVFFRTGEPQALYAKFLASLSAPTAFTFGADLLAQYESSSTGASWGTVFADPFPMAAVIGLLILDAKLYLAIAWYLDQVLPGTFGPRQHWTFVLRPSYWQAHGQQLQEWLHTLLPAVFGEVQRQPYTSVSNGMDAVTANGSADLEAGTPNGDSLQSAAVVSVRQLFKAYGAMQALQGISFEAQAGQITVLLGHNGAGKSTLVQTLCGMLQPSSGDILLNGRSVALEPGAVQAARLGLCPQRNVLFDTLTVREHLVLFAAIRGMPGDQHAAVAAMAEAVGLAKKFDVPAASLSGGMKRKLQVGIALLGSPAVCIMDEPSSGMDAVARQGLRTLLRRAKQDTALLLTTHFMDEADVLSDEIVILAAGRLACHGPSLALKERYGDGYMLTVTAAVDQPVDADAISSVITQHVAAATVQRACGGELVFRLPSAAATSAALPRLLDALDNEGKRLGLVHWGISTPSLEEVFMRTSAAAEDDVHQRSPASAEATDGSMPAQLAAGSADAAGLQDAAGSSGAAHPPVVSSDRPHVPGSTYRAAGQPLPAGLRPTLQSTGGLWQQARAFREMLRKRALTTSRDVRGAVFTLLLPIVAVAAVLSILKVNIDPTAPRMDLTLKRFGQELPVPVVNPPEALQKCMQPPGQSSQQGYGISSRCGAAGQFVSSTANNSYALSQDLLQGLGQGVQPQYGALVFRDNITQHVAERVGAAVHAALPQLSRLNASAVNRTDWQQQLGDGWALASTLLRATPGGRVAAGFAQRLVAPAVTLMHNGSSYHALPALLSDLHEAAGALASGNSSAGPDLRMQSHPLPLTQEESIQLDTVLNVLAAVFLLIPFCYLSGAYAIAPVAERAVSATHMQLISGCSALSYWGGHYVWDAATHLVLSVLSVAIFAAFGDEATTGSGEKVAAGFLLLMMYGLAVIPLAYCQGFSFSNPTAAQVAVAGINFVFGFLLVVGSYVMAGIPETQAAQRALVPFARLLPPFNLGEGLIELSKYNLEKGLADARAAAAAASSAAAAALPSPPQSGVFAYHVLGRSLLHLAAEAAAFFALVVLLERASSDGNPWAALAEQLRNWVKRLTGRSYSRVPQAAGAAGKAALGGDVELTGLTNGHAALQGRGLQSVRNGSAQHEAEDSGVAAERDRVLNGDAQQDAVCLAHLHKRYGPHGSKAAVEDVCLGIRRCERFGFLGPNGAGKTTALSILAGRQRATSGAAFVAGAPAGTTAAQVALGYCPQVDPLLGLLTGLEHLQLFLRLKGVAEAEVVAEALGLLRRVGLPREMALRPSATYSGGNKRKLSLAIALAGRPAAILLDEPSSGMDPRARRAMWGAILAATQAADVAVVLTTHSMEEVEVLCSRVGIMHTGRLACVGSPQQLKSLYGGSYLLEIFGADDTAGQAAIVDFAAAQLDAAPAEAPAGGRLRFALPPGSSLPEVFRAVEAARQQLGIQTYSLSQPTLEQVFVNVVGGQLEAEAGGDDLALELADD